MTLAPSERRLAKRYPMDVPIRLGADRGRTRDVSSRGVYVQTPARLETGAAVEMDLTLTNAFARGPVTLHVRGYVTRVTQHDQERCLAVAIEDWDITEPGLPGFARA
jgi:hypothetical protein